VFMDTIGDFGLPSALAAVYRFPTLPYSIYSAIYTSPIRFDMAGVLSFYLVLFIAIAMFVQFYALRKARFDFLSSRATAAVPKKMGRKGLLLTAGNVLFLILVIGIPMGTNVAVSFMNNISRGFVWSNWTLHYYRELFVNKQALFQGLYHSLMIAGSTAVISLIIGFLVAYVLIYSRFRWKRLIDIFSLVTLAVPGVVLGIGYIFVWNQAWLENIGLLLYGTPWILVLASVAGAIPIITRIIIGSLTKIPIQLIHAAELQGVGFIRRSHEILLPLIRGALLSAGLAAFGSSVFDLAVSTILYPPNFMTLPVAINKGFEDLKFGYATAATMLGGGFVILIILLLELAFRRKERQLHD
ncbi:ABC transporter permease subunit, partial [Paenibacillus sepulcri]|nr:ABC transporter permease subunit [Paenibacillus sepulcri]